MFPCKEVNRDKNPRQINVLILSIHLYLTHLYLLEGAKSEFLAF